MIDYNRRARTRGKLVLHCWDICSMQSVYLSHDNMHLDDLKYLLKMQKKHGWGADIPSILNKSYDALVLTNREISIQWVNDGFEAMTGYSRKYAVGRKPSFLQGVNTTPGSKNRFRKNLAAQRIFTERVINYRKFGDEYLCKIQVYPLCDATGEPVHFLALENEVLVMR